MVEKKYIYTWYEVVPLIFFKKRYESLSYIVPGIPGIRHTHKIYVSFSYVVPGHILSYTFSEQSNAATRYHSGVMFSPLSQGSDSGETPLFLLEFPILDFSGPTLVSIRGVHPFPLAPCCRDEDERATKCYHNVQSKSYKAEHEIQGERHQPIVRSCVKPVLNLQYCRTSIEDSAAQNPTTQRTQEAIYVSRMRYHEIVPIRTYEKMKERNPDWKTPLQKASLQGFHFPGQYDGTSRS